MSVYSVYVSHMEHTYPEWNVIVENANRRRIEIYNVLNKYFLEELKKIYHKTKGNKAEFEECLRGEIMYRYWSKCEWEIIATSMFADTIPDKRFHEEKIDVSDQIFLNWPAFVDYVWNYFQSKSRKRKGTVEVAKPQANS